MLKTFYLKTVHQWKILLRDRAYFVSFLIGWVLLIGGNFINILASAYKDTASYLSVGDPLLGEIPTYDLSYIYIWGFYLTVFLLTAYVLLLRPEIAPFSLKTFGILLAVRAGFVLLINIGPPIGFLYGDTPWDQIGTFDQMFFKNDLFFSGHTAVPFLGFLLFKGSKFRWVMFAISLIMGATVLLMHVHYSIDVFAAFFITHGIYSLSNRIFKGLNVRFKDRLEKFGWGVVEGEIT